MSDVTVDLGRVCDALAELVIERSNESFYHDLITEAKMSLASLLIESRDTAHALEGIRSAWNAHMETCSQHAALPVLPAPTEDELRARRDAPSGTASA